VAARLDLKIGILRSTFRTQRNLSVATRIPEIKLSKIVCGLAVPNSTERAALTAALGQDFFAHEGHGIQPAAELRARG